MCDRTPDTAMKGTAPTVRVLVLTGYCTLQERKKTLSRKGT
jgi:hypothetical protein